MWVSRCDGGTHSGVSLIPSSVLMGRGHTQSFFGSSCRNSVPESLSLLWVWSQCCCPGLAAAVSTAGSAFLCRASKAEVLSPSCCMRLLDIPLKTWNLVASMLLIPPCREDGILAVAERRTLCVCEQAWAPLCCNWGSSSPGWVKWGRAPAPACTAASLPTGDQWLVLPPRGGPGQDQAPEGGHEEAEAEHRCVPPQEYPRGCWQGLEEESLLCLSLCVEQPQPHCTLCPHGHCSVL